MNIQSTTAISSYYQQNTSSSAVTVASALSALKINPRAKFDIQDSAANIEKNLDSLKKIVNNVKTVALTDASASVIHLTSAQFLGQGSTQLFSKLASSGGTTFSLSVSDVLAKDVATISANNNVSQFAVKDSAANIVLKLGALTTGADKLGDLKLTNAGVPLKLTYAQYASSKDSVLGHLVGTVGLDVTGANTSQALAMGSDNSVNSVSILDHAQAIADNLDALQSMGLKIKTLNSDDQKVFKVSASQLQADSAVIGKIYKGYQLAVFNLDATSALDLKSNKKVISLDIQDTSSNIAQNLILLNRLGNQLHSLTLTDAAAPLSVTSSDFLRFGQVLNKIVQPDAVNNPDNTPAADLSVLPNSNIYKLNIVDASAVDAQAIKNNAHVQSITVKDSSSAIALNLDDLTHNPLVTGIGQTGVTSALNITADQLGDPASALSLLNENYTLNVRGVGAANAKALFDDKSNHISSLSVSDTGANIVDNLDALTALGKNLTTIVQTDAGNKTGAGPSLQLSASDWMSHIGVLSKIDGGYGVNLTNVSAAKALSLASDLRVQSLQVSDTGAAISSNLDALQGLGPKLLGITQSDATAIQITGKQYDAYANTLSKLGDTYTLSVTNARANQIQALASNVDHVHDIRVTDSVGNIANNLAALQTAVTQTGTSPSISVSMTGSPSAFNLSKTHLDDYADALNSIEGNYSVNVTGVAATDATDLAANRHVVSMVVNDNAADLSDPARLAALRALGTKLSSIQQSDAGTALSLGVTDWAANMGVLSKINGYRVSLNDVKAASADNLVQSNSHIQSVNVSDTAGQISSNFDKLVALGASLKSITQSDSANLQLTMVQWNHAANTLSKLPADPAYQVDISGASAPASKALGSNASIASVSITDNAAAISTNLDDLMDNSKVTAIHLSGPTTPIALSMAQLSQDAQGNNVLSTIQGGYGLAVGHANISDMAALNANGHVVSAELEGTSSQIEASLASLMNAGQRLKSLTLSDPNSTLSLNYSDFQKYKSVLGMIKEPFKLSLSNVTANGAIAEGQDTQFSISMNVKDTAAQISSNLDGLADLGSKLTTVSTVETLPVLNIVAKQYLANLGLFNKINLSESDNSPQYKLAVTGGDLNFASKILSDTDAASHIQSMDVSDSASTVSTSFDLLQNSKLTSVHLPPGSSVLTITAAQYSSIDATALAKIKGSFSLEVTAAAKSAATALQADHRVSSFSLAASTSEIGSGLPSLLGMSKLNHIDITQVNGAMAVTADQLTAVQDDLGKLHGNYSLNVTGVSMSNLDGVMPRSYVSGIQVTDTSEAIATGWDTLSAMGDQLTGIQVTTSEPLAITLDQWNQSDSALSQLPAGQQLALLDVPADQASAAASYTNVASVSVKGSADQVSAKFDDLVNLGSKLDVIELTNDAPLTLTQSQVDAGTTTLDKVIGGLDVQITA